MSRRNPTSPGIAQTSAQPTSAQPTEANPPVPHLTVDRTPNPVCAVADVLLAPAFLCHRARCRRHRGCSLPGATAPDPDIPVRQQETCFPRCVKEAPAHIRAEFMLFLAALMHVEKRLEPGLLQTWNGIFDTDDDTNAGIHAALTLAARRLPAGDPLLAEFREFWRAEDARKDGNEDEEAFAGEV